MPGKGWKQTEEAKAARAATIKERYGDDAHHQFGLKAAETNRKRYSKDFYKMIGPAGGEASNTGGFASLKVGADGLTGKERASVAGAKGGANSRRPKAAD